MLVEYDMLIEDLRTILDNGLYCEDNTLRIRNSVKYDLYNLMYNIDTNWVKDKLRDIEYEEENF